MRGQEQLRQRAETDGLTGLANREIFGAVLQRATHAISVAGATHGLGMPLATVVLIDCDGFEQVNDTYGHLTGDAVLLEVSRRLRLGAEVGDLPARLGGDEFVTLLRPVHRAAARARVEQLTDLLSEVVEAAGRTIALSCSVGSAEVWSDQPAEEVLYLADMAMYAAKGAGRAHHASLDWPVLSDDIPDSAHRGEADVQAGGLDRTCLSAPAANLYGHSGR